MIAFLQFPFIYLVRRELISTMRRGRVFLLVAVVTAAAIGITAYSWPNEDMIFSTAANYSSLFTMMGMQFLSIACMLFVPGFAANSITTERRQETADLLQLTLIRPSGIILAKLSSCVAFYVMLVIAVIPVFSVLFFLVGIDWPTLGKLFLMTLVSAVTCGLIGIHTSANGRRGAHVIVYTYGKTLLLIMILPMLVSIGLIRFMGLGGALSGLVPWSAMGISLAYETVLSAILFTLSVRAWSRPIRPARGEVDKSIEDRHVLRQRRWSYPFYIVDPLKRKKPIKDGQNPMMVKDIRWGLSGDGSTWARWFTYAFLLSLLISLGTVYVDSRDMKVTTIVLWFQLMMTVLFAPGLLANSFTKELESGGLDMLRLTLLRPSELIIGKFLGGAVFLAPIVLSWIVLSCVMMMFTGPKFIEVKLVGYATIVLCGLLCLASSLLASLLTRRSGSAAALSYLFAFILFVGVRWATDVFLSLFQWPRDQINSLAHYLSPHYAFWVYTESTRVGTHVVDVWASTMTIFSVVCAVLVWVSVQVFKRMHQRDV